MLSSRRKAIPSAAGGGERQQARGGGQAQGLGDALGRQNVDPMLALRTVVCSGRWEEVWPEISQRLREKARERRLGRWVRSRRPEGLEAKTDSRAQTRQRPPSADKRPRKHTRAIHSQASNPRTSPHRIPAANHPWRRMVIGRKCLSPNHPQAPTRKPDAHPMARSRTIAKLADKSL